MALSGSFNTTGYDGQGAPYYLQFYWEATQSIANNTSTVTWTVTVKGGSGYNTVSKRHVRVGSYDATKGSDWLDGTQLTVYNGTVISDLGGSTVIQHNADGTGSFSATLEAAFFYSFVGLNYQYNSKKTQSFTLDQIPRQAKITSASEFTDQTYPTMEYSNPAGSIATLEACISLDGTTATVPYRSIESDGSTYIFMLTDTDKNVLRNAETTGSLEVFYIIKTIIGSNVFYDVESSYFHVADTAGNKPTISMSVTPDNTGIASTYRSNFAARYVQNVSKASVAISATAKYSATIASYAGSVGSEAFSGSSYTSNELTSNGTVNVIASATDSRGLTGSDNSTIDVIPYTQPYLSNASVFRCDSHGVAKNNGEYLKITATKNYASVDSLNHALVRYRTKRANESWSSQAWTTILARDSASNTYASVISGSFAKNVAFTVQVACVDDIGKEYLQEFDIPTEDVNFHLRKGGHGVAVGKFSEHADRFEVAYDSDFEGDVNVAGDESVTGDLNVTGALDAGSLSASLKGMLLDVFYPVGTIYTSTASTSPATLFGGTWSRIKDVFLLAAGDVYTAGATGGEAEHTLTVNEMPSHTHSVSAVKWDKPSSWCTIDEYYGNVSSGVTSGSAGGDQAHNNMPPYLVVYVWERTA